MLTGPRSLGPESGERMTDVRGRQMLEARR